MLGMLSGLGVLGDADVGVVTEPWVSVDDVDGFHDVALVARDTLGDLNGVNGVETCDVEEDCTEARLWDALGLSRDPREPERTGAASLSRGREGV